MAIPKVVPLHINEKVLEAYSFGKLDPPTRASIGFHLEECLECSDAYFRQVKTISRMKQVLLSLEALSPLEVLKYQARPDLCINSNRSDEDSVFITRDALLSFRRGPATT